MTEENQIDSDYIKYLNIGKYAFVLAMAGDLEKAKNMSNQLLEYANKYSDWNSDNARHVGWTVLGIIASIENNIDYACVCLHKSAQIEGSPQLKSFGPNMFLAKKLIELGRNYEVIKYLELVNIFWDQPHPKKWVSMIKSGEKVDFCGNLMYGIIA